MIRKAHNTVYIWTTYSNEEKPTYENSLTGI